MYTDASYDVVICGAGLAGLTLARQLKLELPQLSVALIDRLTRPLPEAAHKIGEATSEMAAHYLSKTLRLEKNLAERQLKKFGLRFFLGDPGGPFEKRPEIGPSVFPPMTTYQVDRGRFENDLRQMVADAGVTLLEGTTVDDMVLGEGSGPHAIICIRGAHAKRYTLHARWVVDALGRRRFLQSKLDLGQSNDHSASAAWWRIDARVDVAEMGVNGGRRWRRRIVEERYLSTNHLMGSGYWVWLIPLASGATSVGIVTDETIHPLHTYGTTYAQALEWLREHEPAAWRLIRCRTPIDFHRLKNYSYHAQQIFSHRRWSCIGEAGIFLDPLYSLGSDFIALENTITTEMIRRDFTDKLTKDVVEDFNHLILDLLAPIGLAVYKDAYRTFGHAHIFAAKHAWETAVYWATFVQVFKQGLLRRPTAEAFALLRQYRDLNRRVQRMFIDWAMVVPPRSPFLPHADLTRMSFLQLLHLDMATSRPTQQCLQVLRLNLDRLEEAAQILFWQAVKECLPQHMPPDQARPPWINAWGISLQPNRWDADRLHQPITASRSLRSMRVGNFAGIFAPMTWAELLRVEILYRLRHVAGGKPATVLIRFLHCRFVWDKPAMWLRRLFVIDYPSMRRLASPYQRIAPGPKQRTG